MLTLLGIVIAYLAVAFFVDYKLAPGDNFSWYGLTFGHSRREMSDDDATGFVFSGVILAWFFGVVGGGVAGTFVAAASGVWAYHWGLLYGALLYAAGLATYGLRLFVPRLFRSLRRRFRDWRVRRQEKRELKALTRERDPVRVIARCRENIRRGAALYGDGIRTEGFLLAGGKLISLLEDAYERLRLLNARVGELNGSGDVEAALKEADGLFAEVDLRKHLGDVPELLARDVERLEEGRRAQMRIIEKVAFLCKVLPSIAAAESVPQAESPEEVGEVFQELLNRLDIPSSAEPGSFLDAFQSGRVHAAIVKGTGLGLEESVEEVSLLAPVWVAEG
jgi:hypothetical protein